MTQEADYRRGRHCFCTMPTWSSTKYTGAGVFRQEHIDRLHRILGDVQGLRCRVDRVQRRARSRPPAHQLPAEGRVERAGEPEGGFIAPVAQGIRGLPSVVKALWGVLWSPSYFAVRLLWWSANRNPASVHRTAASRSGLNARPRAEPRGLSLRPCQPRARTSRKPCVKRLLSPSRMALPWSCDQHRHHRRSCSPRSPASAPVASGPIGRIAGRFGGRGNAGPLRRAWVPPR